MNSASVIVYQATNRANGKRYIGFTTRALKVRVAQHIRDARAGSDFVFHRAIRKYGAENIEFQILADFGDDEDLAKLYEFEAIAKYHPEYNLTYGGDGGTLHPDSRKKISDANRGRKMPPRHGEKRRAFLTGRKHTEETKAKMRAAQKGHAPSRTGPLSEDTKRKISAANKGQIPWTAGKNHSLETRAKMSAWQVGRTLPSETRGRISAGRKKAWVTPSAAMVSGAQKGLEAARAARSLAVQCVTDGRVFDSCSDADRFYGFSTGRVSRILKGAVTNNTGMLFEYRKGN